MDITRNTSIVAALLFTAIAAAADPAPAATPATAAAAEPPYVGEPMALTAEQRQEAAFRVVQHAMDRQRSDKVEDEELIVCMKEKPTGSNVSVINCTTNRFWKKIRSASMSAGIAAGGMTPGGTGAYGSGGGGSARKEDKVMTLSMNDYYKMEKRFGKAPKTEAGKP